MATPKELPSKRWTCFDEWDFGGFKERLEGALARINKAALLHHAQSIVQREITMSEPFSAGNRSVCFEMVVDDGRLIIARVRLPRHPDDAIGMTEDDDAYITQCEVATMRYLRMKLPTVPVPLVYACEGPGSPLAAEAGAAYMLIEGFYGTALQTLQDDFCLLPVEHIVTQWARIEAELATISLPEIGSICALSESEEPVIGPLTGAIIAGFKNTGPFGSSREYFVQAANAAIARLSPSAVPGALTFRSILRSTVFFDDIDSKWQFPLSHMDLVPANILVDNDFNIVAIIDWEDAHTVPWQVFRYPTPLAQTDSSREAILQNPRHIAYDRVSRHQLARHFYSQGHRLAEKRLRSEGRFLGASISEIIVSPASEIYCCFFDMQIHDDPDHLARLAERMEQLAHGKVGEGQPREAAEARSTGGSTVRPADAPLLPACEVEPSNRPGRSGVVGDDGGRVCNM